MSVYVEVSGAGDDLVLVHGWGLHGGLFGALVPALATTHRVHVVDLPGHGRSAPTEPGLRAWARAVERAVPARAAWLGWSLGALVALRAALDARVEQVGASTDRLFEHGDPDPRALADGLDILRDTDLRAELGALATQTLAVAGSRDRLTPPGAAREIAARAPHARAEVLAGVAHAPFLDNPAAFAARVLEFLDGR